MQHGEQGYAGIGQKLEEAGSRLLFRVYEWGKNTAKDVEKLETDLSLAVLGAFEESLKKLVRWGGWSISELTQSVRSKVEAGIEEAEERIMREVDGSYAIFKDADRCDRDLKRCELAATYVRQKTEARIRAVAEKWADAAVSFVLRQSEADKAEKASAIEAVRDSETERERLEERLSKLNATLKDAVTKFVGNRKSLLTELEAEKTARADAVAERDDALAERDGAVDARNAAFTERDEAVASRDDAIAKMEAAVRETGLARSLYDKVARKADEADKIAELLRGYGKSGASPALELSEILNEVRRANAEISSLRTQKEKTDAERTAFQRTTARNFELERQVSVLNETLTALENQVRAEIALRIEAENAVEAVISETPRTETELRATSWAYFSVMLRMEGSDPEAQDYSDYERLERELETWIGLAQGKGIDAFSVSARSVALARDEWLSNPASLKSIGVSRISVQAAYEKCVREIGRMTVPRSVRDVAEKLKIYSDVAWITGARTRNETIVDAEYR